ncbi:MAG: DUF86 domain-containing protein [Candidatus Cloacimonetes bacterium]|nr:DUF86 domain-containing protein [Candidatus Cloacimonadota bacterium]
MPDKDKFNLLTILESIEKIFKYSMNFSNADMFYENQREFDAVMMNFIVIGEMASRLSENFININNHIEWTKIRNFRNIVAHNYFGIDAEEVWQIIKNKLPQLENELHKILKELD